MLVQRTLTMTNYLEKFLQKYKICMPQNRGKVKRKSSKNPLNLPLKKGGKGNSQRMQKAKQAVINF